MPTNRRNDGRIVIFGILHGNLRRRSPRVQGLGREQIVLTDRNAVCMAEHHLLGNRQFLGNIVEQCRRPQLFGLFGTVQRTESRRHVLHRQRMAATFFGKPRPHGFAQSVESFLCTLCHDTLPDLSSNIQMFVTNVCFHRRRKQIPNRFARAEFFADFGGRDCQRLGDNPPHDLPVFLLILRNFPDQQTVQ